MGAAVDGIDAVRKTVDRLGITVVILEGYFDGILFNLFIDVNWLGVLDFTGAVQVMNVAADAALKVKGLLNILSFVPDADFQTLVKVGHFTDAVGQNIIVIDGITEDFLVCQELDGSASAFSRADLLDWTG